MQVITGYSYVNPYTSDDVDEIDTPVYSSMQVATFHTHPLGTNQGVTRSSRRDRLLAEDRGIPTYIHGPNGWLIKYDPALSKPSDYNQHCDIIITKDLPEATYKPWRD